MLVCNTKHSHNVRFCTLHILVNVVGHSGIPCIQSPFMHNVHTAYCRNNASSMLVCYSKHSHSVLCCILRILANVAGHLGVSCKTDNKHTAEVLECYSSCAPFILHILTNVAGYLVFHAYILPSCTVYILHTAKIIRVVLVCDSEHIYNVLYCILYKYLSNRSFYSMHTASLHAQYTYCKK